MACGCLFEIEKRSAQEINLTLYVVLDDPVERGATQDKLIKPGDAIRVASGAVNLLPRWMCSPFHNSMRALISMWLVTPAIRLRAAPNSFSSFRSAD